MNRFADSVFLNEFGRAEEDIIIRFERCLRSDESFDFEVDLANVKDVDRPRLIAEMACIELEYAFELGREPNISSFVERFPEVFRTETFRNEIAKEHYRLLRLNHRPIEPDAIAERYGVETRGWLRLPLGEVNEDSYPSLGTEFCNYPLWAELGRGALSRVYLARQPDLAERLVVLKLTRQRTHEATELAKLQHSGIIPIYSIHQRNGIYAICMPYLGAMTLAHLLRDERLLCDTNHGFSENLKHRASTVVASRLSTIFNNSFSQQEHDRFPQAATSVVTNNALPSQDTSDEERIDALEQLHEPVPDLESLERLLGFDELTESVYRNFFMQDRLAAKLDVMKGVVQAVAHAHSRGVVHQDLKPENILIANDGRPVVLDFNLAQSRTSEMVSIGGTIPYMSLQQLQGLQQSSPVAKSKPDDDVFALGVILYQLLTCRLPFLQASSGDLNRLIETRSELPKSPRQYDQAIPRYVESVVMKCLAPEAERRYPSAIELYVDLTRIKSNLPLKYAKDHSLKERLQRWIIRHPVAVSTSSITTLALVLIVGLSLAFFSVKRTAQRLAVNQTWNQIADEIPAIIALLQSPGAEVELISRGLTRATNLTNAAGISEEDAMIKELRYADEIIRQKAHSQLGRLMYAMAGAIAELEFLNNRFDSVELDKASKWNLRAAETSPDLRSASLVRAARIENLRSRETNRSLCTAVDGKSESEPIADFARAETTYAKMLLAREKGLVDQWLLLANQLVNEGPADPSNWITLGSALLASNQLAIARDAFDVAARLGPESTVSIFWRGVLNFKLENWKDAESDFSRCVQSNEKWIAARYNRALCYQHQGNVQKAIDDLDWLVNIGATHPRVYSLRAQLLRRIGDFLSAANDHKSALQAIPCCADDWVTVGVLKMHASPRTAMDDFNRAIALMPNHTAAHFNAAHVQSELLNDIPGAIKSLSQLVDSNQRTAPVLASRGILYARLKDHQRAKQDASAAQSAHPGALEMLQIAGIYALCGESAEDKNTAFHWLARSIAVDPKLRTVAANDPDLQALQSAKLFQFITGDVQTSNAPPSDCW